MHELRTILDELASERFASAALVTLVARSGSSYRKPGARMLVSDDSALGAVSGGCLESSLHLIAREVIAEQRSRLVTIDTSREDDLLWGYGLGCPGVLQFLVEPLSAGTPPQWLTAVGSALERHQRAIIVTEISVTPRRLVVSGDESVGDESLADLARNALETGTSSHVTSDDSEFFVEVVDPPLSILVFGAGDDAVPLTRFATELGWETTVVDRRPAFAKPERFPLAKRVIAAHVEEIDPELLKTADAAVITTHHYATDRALLELLAPTQLRYIGIVGSPRRFRQLTDELMLKSTDSRIFGPAGLDLGAEGAAEIALSIVAQIRAVFAGCDGGRIVSTPPDERVIALDDDAIRPVKCDLEER